MPRAYSSDLRRRIVAHYLCNEKRAADTAAVFSVSVRVVQLYAAQLQRTGDVEPAGRERLGRKRILSPGVVAYLRALVDERADWYLCELLDALQSFAGFPLSMSTLVRTVQRLGITYKKTSVIARECNTVLCDAFLMDMRLTYDVDQLVFLDETAKDERTLARRYGYSHKGQRAALSAPFIRGERFTATAVLATTGLVAYEVIPGASNTERLLRFIVDCLLPEMNPFPGPRSVLVMDNCVIHHNVQVKLAVEAAGCRIRYLPPYAPFLNPIEEAFAGAKAWIRSHDEYCATLPAISVLHEALCSAVDAAKAIAWIRHSGYRFPEEPY